MVGSYSTNSIRMTPETSMCQIRSGKGRRISFEKEMNSGSSVCGKGVSRDYVAPSGVFSTAAVGVRDGMFLCGVFTYVVA